MARSAPTHAIRRRTQASKPVTSLHLLVSDSLDPACEDCGSSQNSDELLFCDKCDRGHHIFCLRPILARLPKGPWFCPSCSEYKKLKRFPLVQTKIVDFFRIQRNTGPSKSIHVTDIKKKRKKLGRLVVSKKKRKLLPFVPSDEPARILKQMASLATALVATGSVFSNELTYLAGMCPRSANRASLEAGGMQILSREDTDSLRQCKSMMERGQWPPLMVVYDSFEGFTVQADGIIKDLTIIAEYTGDVDYLINREQDDSDSMMTLLSAEERSKCLVICPDKRSNIARFVSGINNHTVEGKKKQNVKCVRFNVSGESRVLLIAIRDISVGERLYYDYNGHEHEYPTHHFV